jgi:hypothetical protein
MPRAITRRCRGIAKASVNICRHHAFPAIFPIFILCSRPDRDRIYRRLIKSRRRDLQISMTPLRLVIGVSTGPLALCRRCWRLLEVALTREGSMGGCSPCSRQSPCAWLRRSVPRPCLRVSVPCESDSKNREQTAPLILSQATLWPCPSVQCPV